MKEFLGFVAIALSLIAYIPYLRDVFKGKTKPHVYSWFIWGLLSLLIAALQLKKGAGPGAYMTLFTGVISLYVALLGARNGKKDITTLDTVMFLMSLVATGIWLITDHPLASMILLILADAIGSIPTFRKSWHKPHEETLFFWAISPVRHAISLLALTTYNLVTILNPITWVIINTSFVILLITRQKSLTS